MDDIKIVTTKLVRESTIKYFVKSPSNVYDFLYTRLKDEPQENFIVISVSSKGTILNATTVSIGTLNRTLIHPREVFRTAIISNASSIILAHNHPSGDSTPSDEDLEVTDMLIKAGEVLDIKVLDHIIIGDEYYSLKKQGDI